MYKFCKLTSLELRKNQLLEFCNKNNILGTILLAEEGINGTISGEEIDCLLYTSDAADE